VIELGHAERRRDQQDTDDQRRERERTHAMCDRSLTLRA
jgi:hypothetical protein